MRSEDELRQAYIDLIKCSITNYVYLGGDKRFEDFRCASHYDLERSQWTIDALSRPIRLLPKIQLDLLEEAILALEERRIAGDLLEAGVWRGGTVLFMRALLKAYAISGRRVFAADSFSGIPMNVRVSDDPVNSWTDRRAASLDEVKQNIGRFGLLDDQIVFVPGYFAESLQTLSNERFALIRLDSDAHDSVEESLRYLYPLVSKGGITIIDDWHLGECQMAVMNYRSRFEIRGEIQVYGGNAYWVKLEDYGYPPLPKSADFAGITKVV